MRSRVALLAVVAVANASPFPQGVTAAIAPQGAAPSGCLAAYDGTFGIAVANISHAPVDEMNGIAPHQQKLPAPGSGGAVDVVQKAAAAPAAGANLYVVSQIGDGQIQAPVSGVRPGQQAAPAPTPAPAPPTSTPVILPPKPTPPKPTGPASPPAPPITISTPAQPPSTTISIAPPTTEEPTTTIHLTSTITRTVYSVTSFLTKRAEPSPLAVVEEKRDLAKAAVACKANGTLALTLKNGVLKDARGWTGYIASNYQFQFDDPPQHGSIYTAGWSLCSNGSLALGGSAVFYQCRSGDFYNLYDRYWAAQCNPIHLNVVQIQDC